MRIEVTLHPPSRPSLAKGITTMLVSNQKHRTNHFALIGWSFMIYMRSLFSISCSLLIIFQGLIRDSNPFSMEGMLLSCKTQNRAMRMPIPELASSSSLEHTNRQRTLPFCRQRQLPGPGMSKFSVCILMFLQRGELMFMNPIFILGNSTDH